MGLLFRGDAATLEQTGRDVTLTFGIALLVVFLVLVAQFEGVTSAAVVLISVPFGLAAAVFAMTLSGTSVNIYTQIGLLLLVGVMAKNSILMVEFAGQLRDAGRSVREAAQEAACLRLRPIVMTMASTVLGALPLVLGSGPGAESRAAIGWVIFGGLSLAAVFTLFLTPVVYLGLARFSKPRVASGRTAWRARCSLPSMPAPRKRCEPTASGQGRGLRSVLRKACLGHRCNKRSRAGAYPSPDRGARPMTVSARRPRRAQVASWRISCLCLTACLLLAGCAQFAATAPGTDDAAATSPLGLTEADRFSADAGAAQPSEDDLRWWRRFDDAALAHWVERALLGHPGVAIADEQVAQARALLRAAQARRGVQLSASADATLRLQRDGGQRRWEPGAALVLDIDTDLWGGLRQAEASAAAGVLRSQDLVQAARLATAGLAARAYLEWRVALQDARLLAEALQLQREVQRVVAVRVGAGLAPQLDQDRAAAELAATESEQAAGQVRIRQAIGALQVLAGERPRPLPPEQDAVLQHGTGIAALQGVQPVTRPIDLLRLRPDLRAAEQALVAAAAEVGVAQAALRPRLRLPGSLVLGAVSGGGLLELVSATLAAALDLSLFDGGAADANVQAARSRARSAQLVYRQTVLQALQQVEAALVAQQGALQRVAARARASDAARAAEMQAQSLYRAGLSGSLDLVDAQRTALANRRALLQARADAAVASVLAFEAMGLIDAAPANRESPVTWGRNGQ